MFGGDKRLQANSFVRADSSTHVFVSLRVGCANTDELKEQLSHLQLAYQNIERQLEYEMNHRSNLVDQQLATHFAPMMQKVSNNDAEMRLLRKRLVTSETNQRSLQQKLLSEQGIIQGHLARISQLDQSLTDSSIVYGQEKDARKLLKKHMNDANITLAADDAALKLLQKELHDAKQLLDASQKESSKAQKTSERQITILKERIVVKVDALKLRQEELHDAKQLLDASQKESSKAQKTSERQITILKERIVVKVDALKLRQEELHDAKQLLDASQKESTKAQKTFERQVTILEERIVVQAEALEHVQQECKSLKTNQDSQLRATNIQLEDANRRLHDKTKTHAFLQRGYLSLALRSHLLHSRIAELQEECQGLEAMLVTQAVLFEDKLMWARRRKKPKPRVDASTQTEDQSSSNTTIIDFLQAQIRNLQANHAS